MDQELSAKIESELQLEREMRDSEMLPSNLQDYLDSSSFEVGLPTALVVQHVLTLAAPRHPRSRRSCSNTQIWRRIVSFQHSPFVSPKRPPTNTYSLSPFPSLRVSFSIADLTNMDSDNDPDPALYDEDDDASIPEASAQSGGANTKGAVNAGHTKGGNINIAPEDRVAPADREELADEESAPANDEDEPSFPARINVMIEKAGKGTLQIETTAQDGEIVIENVYYFKDAELADAKTAELDWKRKDLYEGPPFGNLDEDLQVLLERYLDERGINTALAMWVPEYIDFKEQREYLNWLSSKSTFIVSFPYYRRLTIFAQM